MESKKSKIAPVPEVTSPEEFEEKSLRKQVADLSRGSWLITQEMLQEIIATQTVLHNGDKSKIPSMVKLVPMLKAVITERYKDDPKVRDLLLKSLPTAQSSYTRWTQQPGWDDAIEAKIKNDHWFSPEYKTQMIKAVFTKGTERGDMRAAEIYFKLSGDLNSDKGKGSKELEDYKDFNRILHSRK